MAQIKTLMDVLKLLERSNCRKCGEKTCMVFAAAVLNGNRTLAECPQVPAEIANEYTDQPNKREAIDQDRENQVAELKMKVMTIDLKETAERIDAVYDRDNLIIRIMGKKVEVDSFGKVTTDIHTIPWVMGPLFNYILNCKGVPIKNRWVPLRELPSGRDWYRLFGQTCEKPMKKVADTYPDLFSDLVEIFNGQPVQDHYQSDVALVLHPLPLVPILICYWRPDDGLESDLNIYFDESAEDNLGIDAIYSLGTGITRMFEKLALRHGIALYLREEVNGGLKMTEKSPVFDKIMNDYLYQVARIEDREGIAALLGITIVNDGYTIPFFNSTYTITTDRILGSDGKSAGHSIAVILCKYLLLCPDQSSHDCSLVTYKDFKDANPYVGGFRNTVEKPIAGYFENSSPKLEKKCLDLGGHPFDTEVSCELAVTFQALPCVPVFLLFNDADEDFSAQATLLFQKNASSYLDMECLAMIGANLAHQLQAE